MAVTFDETKKDLPPDQLRQLFMAVGWSDGLETDQQKKLFNMPFVNSGLVVSAWEGDHLIGAVRVLTDGIVRSVLYDLAILPEYQGKGIGRELVKRCRECFPGSEWLVQTDAATAGYYRKMGFNIDTSVFLTVPSRYSDTLLGSEL